MLNQFFHKFCSQAAKGLKHALLLGSVALLVACGAQPDDTSSTAAVSSTTGNALSVSVGLLDSLDKQYPKGQMPAGSAEVSAEALAQNPRVLTMVNPDTQKESSSTFKAQLQAMASVVNGVAVMPVYRIQNTTLPGSYFFTIYDSERVAALAANPSWKYEGPAFYASQTTNTGLSPVWRFRNKLNGSYVFSIYDSERLDILNNYAATYAYEGISWYARQTVAAGWTPLYRFRNLTNGTYLFSAYETEKASILANLANVFAYEGIAYYVKVGTAATGPFSIGGNVSGLGSGTPFWLKNIFTDNFYTNASGYFQVTANGSFNFSYKVTPGGTYDISMYSQPAGQTCTVTNGIGTAFEDVTTVSVVCAINTYAVGGTVSGLAVGKSVTLLNNGGNSTTLSANGNFSFSTPIATGSPYAVVVATQPVGQFCLITAGAGTVTSTVVSSVRVECFSTAVGSLADTGIDSNQCYFATSDLLGSCLVGNATSLSPTQDGMVGRDPSSINNADGRLGFSYSAVSGQALTNCVKDTISGLVWEVKTADGGLRDRNKTYTNYASSTQNATYGTATDATGYASAINALALCGYTDWRLPTRQELQELVDYSVITPSPTIVSAWFPNTAANVLDWRYWTSSAYVLDALDAWKVGFSIGDAIHGERAYDGHVRLVRGSRAVPTQRFYFTAAAMEVHDTTTGLSWRRCPEGYYTNPTDITCASNYTSTFTHESALTRAKTIATSTGKAWRVPNAKELLSIADATKSGPPFDTSLFPNNSNDTSYTLYWTSTPYVGKSKGAWAITLNGTLTPNNRTPLYPLLRLVRDTQ